MRKKACQGAFQKWSESPKIDEFSGKKQKIVGKEKIALGIGLACGLGRRRGSDSPPGCHSLPRRFKSSTDNEKRRPNQLVWSFLFGAGKRT